MWALMLYVLPDSAGDILVLQANGTLEQSDFAKIFLTQIEKQLKPGHTLRVLLYLDQDFKGVDTDSSWSAKQLIVDSNVDIQRIAIVSNGAGEAWSKQFDSEAVQHFSIAQFLKALHWCDEPL